jgi:hypothetical protein
MWAASFGNLKGFEYQEVDTFICHTSISGEIRKTVDLGQEIPINRQATCHPGLYALHDTACVT